MNFAKKHKAAIDLVEIGYSWFIFNKPEWNRLWGEHNKKQKPKDGRKKKKKPTWQVENERRQAEYVRQEKRREYEKAVGFTLVEWLLPIVLEHVQTGDDAPAFCAKYLMAAAIGQGLARH